MDGDLVPVLGVHGFAIAGARMADGSVAVVPAVIGGLQPVRLARLFAQPTPAALGLDAETELDLLPLAARDSMERRPGTPGDGATKSLGEIQALRLVIHAGRRRRGLGGGAIPGLLGFDH